MSAEMASNRRHGWMSQKDFGKIVMDAEPSSQKDFGKMVMEAEPGAQSIASRVKIIPGAVYIIEVNSVGNIIEGTRDSDKTQEELFKILATNIGTHMKIGNPATETPLERGTVYLSRFNVNGHTYGLIFKSPKGNSSLYMISINNNNNIKIQGGRTHRSRRTRRSRRTCRSRKH